jgi:hypothetical protein
VVTIGAETTCEPSSRFLAYPRAQSRKVWVPPALVRLAGNVRAWRVAEANAIIAAARGERILSKPRRPISETNFSLLAWEARTAQQMWACASRRPSAGGNIGGRRRASLAVQDFGLYGWPCARCGLV